MKKLICLILAMLLLTACGAETPVATEGEKFDPTAQILGQTVEFAPWEQAGLPTDGSYYLTKDVELAEAVTVTGDLKLHLNGHNIVAQDGAILTNMFVIPAGTAMTVYDAAVAEDPFAEYDSEEEEQPKFTVDAGAIISSHSFAGQMTVSSMFRVAGTLTIAGGHVDGSEVAIEDRNNGSVAYVEAGGKLELAGGYITAGASWRYAPEEPVVPETPADPTAPTESTEPTEPVEPEVVETFGCGGGIYIAKDGECTVSGGTIYGGSACEGGNIYVAEGGTLNVTGGRLLAGEATKQGGNVCVAGTMNMSAGNLDWGTSYGCGGNIFLSGNLNITGGTLEGGVCDKNTRGESYGGNLTVNGDDAKVSISGAQILNGRAPCKESHGGNIAVVRRGADSFEVGEGTLISGGLGHRGGNVYIGHLDADVLPKNLDYVFTGVEMSEGATTYRGANLCTHNKKGTLPIEVTFNDCILYTNGSERTMAIGAGAALFTEAIITINGGEYHGGEFHIYEHATVTANNALLDGCIYGGPGKFINNSQPQE